MVCTLQEIWRCYLPPSEKKFYSTLHKKNCILHACSLDVALPLSLQKFFLGIYTLKKLRNKSETNHLKKMFRKAILLWYLAQYWWNPFSLIIYWAINFKIFSFAFLLKTTTCTSFLLYWRNLKGHNMSLSRCSPLLLFLYTM